jgi:hypothetical protein
VRATWMQNRGHLCERSYRFYAARCTQKITSRRNKPLQVTIKSFIPALIWKQFFV